MSTASCRADTIVWGVQWLTGGPNQKVKSLAFCPTAKQVGREACRSCCPELGTDAVIVCQVLAGMESGAMALWDVSSGKLIRSFNARICCVASPLTIALRVAPQTS